jgi:hypothetical protein
MKMYLLLFFLLLSQEIKGDDAHLFLVSRDMLHLLLQNWWATKLFYVFIDASGATLGGGDPGMS